MSKIKKRTKAVEVESAKRVIKNSKHLNNLGYDVVTRAKQEEFSIWYSGESDALLQFYIEARATQQANVEQFWNSKDYFWAMVGKEDEVKCTHSGLPKAMVDTLVNIMGTPEITASKEELVKNEDTDVKELKNVDDILTTERIADIIKDNEFFSILKQEQETYTMVVGDGAYFINIDTELSEYPIIEFIDGRNVEFERKANRITAITARKYYTHNDKGYMLTDRRSTRLIVEEGGKSKKRVATVEYNLYELANLSSEEAVKEVDLKTIPDTEALENLEFLNINTMLAVPCIYRYNKNTERGESFYASKLDLFDDLDQSKSQSSNTTRLSTPVDYLPEALLNYDENGKVIPPKKYDRRFLTVRGDKNSVGQNMNEIVTTQPQLNTSGYTAEQEALIGNILIGILSPATLGVNMSIKDNALAMREKEKVTLVTRDYLVGMQMQILEKLFNLVLKIDDYIKSPTKKPGDYGITINYPEYANPTFENKLTYLVPAFVNGGMSAKRYVGELWGDSLSEEEVAEEIKTIEQYKNAFNQMQAFESEEDEMIF